MSARMMQIGGAFRICAADAAAALATIKALAGRETVRGPRGLPHFMWVDPTAVDRAASLEDALREWRWLVLGDDGNGDLTGLSFEGEKVGDEDLLFQAIAPYVQAGSWLAACTEEGDVWRWWFDGRTVTKQAGRISYEEGASDG